jgi:hypothetical protein
MANHPVDRPQLRREVGMLRARESRRVFDAVVSVGVPAGDRDSFVVRAQDLPVMDPALCTDVVSSLVEQAPSNWTAAWLARPGSPHLHDLDMQWLSAATVAFGIHARTLQGFFAITRGGWLDVRTGERQEWKRLRL